MHFFIRKANLVFKFGFFSKLFASAAAGDEPLPFVSGSPFIIREPFPPVRVPSKKPRPPSYPHRLTPAWEDILYMGHRPPASRQNFSPHFVAVEQQQTQMAPPGPHFSDIPLEFLRHQYSLGLPLGSPFVGKDDTTDFRNMPLGTLGTGGGGYGANNPYEGIRRKEATMDLLGTIGRSSVRRSVRAG